VNPHSPEVITQQVVQRVAGEEAQAVRDPVSLVRVVIKVGLGLLAQFADGLGTLLVGTGPNAQRDTVQSVRRILLENEGVVGAVRLALAGANLDIVGEACLVKTMLADLKSSATNAFAFQECISCNLIEWRRRFSFYRETPA
jgi:hypothetical protein